MSEIADSEDKMTNVLRQPKGFYRNVFALMAPMVLQNLITHTVALTDTFMVGMLGEQYLAAVTIAQTPLFIFMIFTFGVQSGAGILVSQYWGKGNLPVINRVLGVGVYFSAAVTLAGAMLLTSFPHQILGLVTNETALVALGAPYARIVCFAMALNSISMIYISCQRNMENPKLGVIILSVSSVFSIFWNWVLIFGNLGFPALGIQGAAISTLSARVLEVSIVTIHAFRNSRFRVKLGLLLKPGMAIFRDFLKYSLPVLLNEALWGFGAMLFPVILGHMAGAQTNLAAYNISGNLERVFAVTMFGCGGATAVIVGREIGAGRRDRVQSIAKSLMTLGFILGLCSGALLMLTRFTILEPFVFPLFDLSPEAASTAAIMLTIVALSLPMRTFGFTMGIGVMRGGGDVKALMIIDVGTLYLIFLPMASTTGLVFGLGIAIVYSSMLVEDLVKTTLLFLRVRSMKWIHDVTREQLE
jgi:putative MATE family efflux protein